MSCIQEIVLYAVIYFILIYNKNHFLVLPWLHIFLWHVNIYIFLTFFKTYSKNGPFTKKIPSNTNNTHTYPSLSACSATLCKKKKKVCYRKRLIANELLVIFYRSLWRQGPDAPGSCWNSGPGHPCRGFLPGRCRPILYTPPGLALCPERYEMLPKWPPDKLKKEPPPHPKKIKRGKNVNHTIKINESNRNR